MQARDSKGRFINNKSNTVNNKIKNNLNNKGENTMMNRTNAKEMRMETLRKANVNTNNFFNLSMNIPVGSNVQVLINGVPYEFNSSNDAIVKDIVSKGWIFNSRTDGRFLTAQTFCMLNGRSYNYKTRQYETGWDAYLRNSYSFMYEFDMMIDELHRLCKMEENNDPEFNRLSSFFTKEVVYQTCKHYIRQLKKFVKNQPTRKCKGVPYTKLNKYGNVFVKDLNAKVYNPLEEVIAKIQYSPNYTILEKNLREFVRIAPKLPYDTPKFSEWKDAFKGKGAYVSLLNIIKFHNVVVQNYETKEILDTYGSVDYVESLLKTYKGQYWRFHELLKATIELNNFDLQKSIDAQNK